MVEYRKPRDAASLALIELRNKMGLTQAGMAVAFLRTAVTTVAKYETSHRPPTEMLLRLSAIARDHAPELADKFKIFYLEDVLKAVGNQITWVPKTESEPAHGYLTTSLSGDIAIRAAADFLTLVQCLRAHPDLKIDAAAEKLRENAVSAFAALQVAAEKGQDSQATEFKKLFFGAHAKPALSAKAVSSKPKRRDAKPRPKPNR